MCLKVQQQNSYVAAVVEFYPEQDVTLLPEERLRRNVDSYLKIFAETYQKKKLDIVVFPEMTLAHQAFIPKRNYVEPFALELPQFSNQSLCVETNKTFLTPLACAAQKNQTYMVLNLYEKVPCNDNVNCSDGWDFYNSNIVLDRNGSVISRYRKYNLFGEYFMNRTETADISTFDTDFGVKFGQFICFDIMFKEPALDLIKKHNISSVVYPSMWFSELPFLTALQAQEQWAHVTNATLLASGANDPSVGSGGSGIFRGASGALVMDVIVNNVSRAFVSDVLKDGTAKGLTLYEIDLKAKEMDAFYLKTDNLEPYVSKLIFPNQKEINETVCHEEFCCKFEVVIEWDNATLREAKDHYQYHMLAYTGVRSFDGVYNGGIEVCGLVACTGENLNSCGKRFPNYNEVSWPATYKSILIQASFEKDEKRLQHPNSLLSHIQPLSANDYEWSSEENGAVVEQTYRLKAEQKRLMTFAIYGRDFNRDSDPRNSGADMLHFKLIYVIILVTVVTYL
ncbi:hypothetical protein FQA39_LY16826 [Lamprigera yunnana]|nr:hypothetical protein FQA39_LY16826 [Lamprigera yunnana]